MKPKLKPPGTSSLKLKCDVMLSTSAFKFDLRRYIMSVVMTHFNRPVLCRQAIQSVMDQVRRCRLTI